MGIIEHQHHRHNTIFVPGFWNQDSLWNNDNIKTDLTDTHTRTQSSTKNMSFRKNKIILSKRKYSVHIWYDSTSEQQDSYELSNISLK